MRGGFFSHSGTKWRHEISFRFQPMVISMYIIRTRTIIGVIISDICDAPKSILCRFKRSRQNPHNNDLRSPTRHNVHAETCALCGWNCDNITTVHEKNPQQQQKDKYIQERLKRVKIQLIHYKDTSHSESKIASDYGQDTNLD